MTCRWSEQHRRVSCLSRADGATSSSIAQRSNRHCSFDPTPIGRYVCVPSAVRGSTGADPRVPVLRLALDRGDSPALATQFVSPGSGNLAGDRLGGAGLIRLAALLVDGLGEVL